jgi:hypothetical protein
MQAPPAQFASQTIRLQFPKDIHFGDDIFVWIAKTGDIVTNMYLHVQWPSDLPTIVQPSAGTAMISRVELMYKNQIIERIYGENLAMLNDLTVPQVMQTTALTNMVGTKTTTRLTDYYIRFPFFIFNKGLPLLALDEAPRLHLIFNPASFFTGVTTYTSTVTMDLYAEYIYVTKPERDYFSNNRLTYLTQSFELVQYRIPPSTSTTTYTFFPQFVNNVAELYWVIQNDSYSNVYDFTNNGSDHLVNLRVVGDGVDLVTPDYATPLYLRGVQGTEFHTRVPDMRFYMYSFALDPENTQIPTGHLNMSAIDRQQHDLTLNASTSSRNIRIYARSYNIFSVYKGDGMTLYPIIEGGSTIGNSNGYTTGALTLTTGTAIMRMYTTSSQATIGSYGSTVDSFGNMYVVTQYAPSALTLYNQDNSRYTASTYQNPLLIKYNSKGFIQWIVRLPSTATPINITSVSADIFSNVTVSGTYINAGTTAITNADGTTFAYNFAASTNGQDAFIFKVNSNGITQWASGINGNGTDGTDGNQPNTGYLSFTNVSTDYLGNSYLALTSNSTGAAFITANAAASWTISNIGTTFNGLASTTYAPNAYLIKYSRTGAIQWVTGMAGASGATGVITSCVATVPQSGTSVMGGWFNSTSAQPFVSLLSTTTAFTSTTSTGRSVTKVGSGINAYLMQVNTSGTLLWIVPLVSQVVQIVGVAYDTYSNVISVFDFYGSAVVFYNPANVFLPQTLPQSGFVPNATDQFAGIVKYDSSGYYKWAAYAGVTTATSTGNINFLACACDGYNNSFAGGYFTAPTIVVYNSDGSIFGTYTRKGTYDGIVVKYNSNGTVQWVVQIGVSGGTCVVQVYSVSIDPTTQNIVITGTYGSTVNPVIIYTPAGVSSGVTLPVTAVYEPFVIKLST